MKKVNKVAAQVDMFFRLKIFILFHNLLLLAVASFIHFSIDDRFTYLLGNRGPTTKESGLEELDDIAAAEAAESAIKNVQKSYVKYTPQERCNIRE